MFPSESSVQVISKLWQWLARAANMDAWKQKWIHENERKSISCATLNIRGGLFH